MTDISAFLNIQDIHDCSLTSISIVDGRDINILIYSESGKEKIGSLIFQNVEYCRFDDFRLGNIIFHISVLDVGDTSGINDTLCYILNKKPDDLKKEWINTIKNNIESKKMLLSELATSYGVYGAVLCRSIAFTPWCQC
jgi:hypothetical protein